VHNGLHSDSGFATVRSQCIAAFISLKKVVIIGKQCPS